jgi:hypothetical protein
MPRSKRGDLGTQEFNVGKRVVSSLRRTLALMSAIRVPEKRVRHFARFCSGLSDANKPTRIPLLLCLLAKAAVRTCRLVFYYAVPSVRA